MCGRYELTAKFELLPDLMKIELPQGFKENYAEQQLIRPSDPVLTVKNEGKISTSFMIWGFVSEWSQDPFDLSRPKPFNARSETVNTKKLFKGSWMHKRCLLPANGFFEKGHRISRKDSKIFWLGGIWNRWISKEGSELETCCVLTTKPNELIKPFHTRMPVIVPTEQAEDWIAPVKSILELRRLDPLLSGWDPNEWKVESINETKAYQMNLFANEYMS